MSGGRHEGFSIRYEPPIPKGSKQGSSAGKISYTPIIDSFLRNKCGCKGE